MKMVAATCACEGRISVARESPQRSLVQDIAANPKLLHRKVARTAD